MPLSCFLELLCRLLFVNKTKKRIQMEGIRSWVILLYVLAPVLSRAQRKSDSTAAKPLQEVVVTATKFATLAERTGRTVSKITRETLRSRPDQSVAQGLNTQLGLQLNGAQMPVGANVSYYLRGGRSRNTSILIDGMPVYDPSGIEPTFDLNLVQTDQLASIEIVKGGASALYGSGASSGVINLLLRRAGEKAIQGGVRLSDASYDTHSQGLDVNGTLDGFHYLITADHFKTEGLSAAEDTLGVGFDKDGSEKQSLLARFGYDLSHGLSLELVARHNRLRYDYDGGSYTDLDYKARAPRGDNRNNALEFQTELKHRNGLLQLKASYNSYAKAFEAYNHSTASYEEGARYHGNAYFAELFDRYCISPGWQLLLGVSYRESDFDQSQSAKRIISSDTMRVHLLAPYLSMTGNWGGLDLNAGFRYSHHSGFSDFYTYSFSPSYDLTRGSTKWVLHTSFSNAYTAPTLYQLYSQYGNAVLKPETSLSWELGLSGFYQVHLKWDVVFFHRDEENRIAYERGKYVNLTQKTAVKGLETAVRYLDKGFESGVNYTYTRRPGTPGLRIPRHRINAYIQVKPFEGNTLRVGYQYTSSRVDLRFDNRTYKTLRVNLPAYALFNLSLSQQIESEKLTLFAALNNVFNRDYQEIIGYNTFGRNAYVGMSYRF